MLLNEMMIPCCKCGGEPKIVSWYIHGAVNIKHYRVECGTCGNRPTQHEYNTLEKAITAWNEKCKNI